MRKLSFVLAASLALAVAGCDDLFGGDDVTVTVTGTANVRDAATTEGSNVIAKLEAGTELSGEWVETGSGSTDKWLEFEFNGKKAFVWVGNLAEEKTNGDNDQAEQNENYAEKNKPSLKSGIYNSSFWCGENKTNCLDEQLERDVCKNSKVSKFAYTDNLFYYELRGVVDDEIGESLVNNNQVYDTSIFWDEEEGCIYKFRLEGFVNGTSVKTNFLYGKTREYKIDESGDFYIFQSGPYLKTLKN